VRAAGADSSDPSARSTHCLEAIGRLKPGVTPNQAQAENNAIEQDLVKQYPRAYIGSDVSTVPPGFGSQVPEIIDFRAVTKTNLSSRTPYRIFKIA